ncbi:MAG: hypothetical protein NXH75_16735 [Halobacteriovoraceae bacterium]|nr:hypothetical protein [Halobacteriovoraceae bacterium]
MIDRLMDKLQTFTDRLDQGDRCTRAIRSSVQEKDWKAVEENTNNRERLLSIIAQEQEAIEAIINSIFSEELTPENINIIKSWAFDTQDWINKTAMADEEILTTLNDSKDEITKEIASIFRSKTAFRGYNLNDVRK